MQLSGAKIVLECLKEQGVNKIFGFPGGAVIPLYDALYDYKEDFTHILTCHEQGAVHAADGYARATGKVGVCFATSGPGATNTVTGIATAFMDSVPLVVITGQVPSRLLGRDSFQEIDITGITLPITKHNYLVKDIKKLPSVIREAFQIAKNGRTGPVLIDITKDVFIEKANYEKKNISKLCDEEKAREKVEIEDIVDLINQSTKPVIYAGGGVILSDASKELDQFVKKAEIPVVNTLMGLGGVSRENRFSLGLVGMHGLKPANLSVTNCDLIIAIGTRFSDRVLGKAEKFAPKAKIIHIDIDKAEIGKNKTVDFSQIGDTKEILRILTKKVEKKDRKQWLEEILLSTVEQDNFTGFNAKNILDCAYRILDKDVIVATEVGQHQMWTAQHWKFTRPRSFISSGGLGTMGYMD